METYSCSELERLFLVSWIFTCVCVCVCVCVEVGGMVGYEEQEVIILDKLENLNHVVSVGLIEKVTIE